MVHDCQVCAHGGLSLDNLHNDSYYKRSRALLQLISAQSEMLEEAPILDNYLLHDRLRLTHREKHLFSLVTVSERLLTMKAVFEKTLATRHR